MDRLSIQEIAIVQKTSTKTVKSRLNRAIEKLKRNKKLYHLWEEWQKDKLYEPNTKS